MRMQRRNTGIIIGIVIAFGVMAPLFLFKHVTGQKNGGSQSEALFGVSSHSAGFYTATSTRESFSAASTTH